jgi:hypothetical protein
MLVAETPHNGPMTLAGDRQPLAGIPNTTRATINRTAYLIPAIRVVLWGRTKRMMDRASKDTAAVPGRCVDPSATLGWGR